VEDVETWVVLLLLSGGTYGHALAESEGLVILESGGIDGELVPEALCIGHPGGGVASDLDIG